jgi:hypothetical protein
MKYPVGAPVQHIVTEKSIFDNSAKNLSNSIQGLINNDRDRAI